MITAERFSQTSGSYWSSVLPNLAKFVSISNQTTRHYADPITLTSDPARRPLITETAFVAWKTGDTSGAEDLARQRLRAVWNQVPMARPLDRAEELDVLRLTRRLSLLQDIPELSAFQIEPVVAGCGFISGGTPDFLASLVAGERRGRVLGEIKMVERFFRSVDYRQMVCYLCLYFSAHRDLLEFLWLVNPIKGVVTHIDVDSFFMLVRGQPASEAVSELLYEWSAPGVSP